jgi:glutamate dehydrogenase
VTRGLFSLTDIIEIAHLQEMESSDVAEVYFGIGDFLDLGWIRGLIIAHPTENHWEALSREALRDDLDWQQRQLTLGILGYRNKSKDMQACLKSWYETHAALIERWLHICADLKSSTSLNYTMFFVAIRELLDLTQTTLQSYIELEEVEGG